jgi:hypothetical protein
VGPEFLSAEMIVYWFGHLGVAAFADERYEDACYWGKKTIQQNPMFPGGHCLEGSELR